jgi:hypothetical protein
MYSVGLGALELTLLEQAHLFSTLYNNELIEQPALHPSLFIEEIILNGKSLIPAEKDTVRRYHPFSDILKLRPVHLGLHNRLAQNSADGLKDFDIPYSGSLFNGGLFYSDNDLVPDGPLANFAKSGTTDDVLRPYDEDISTTRRTNYCLWNAVVRLNMSALGSSSDSADIKDVVVSCVGEGNTKRTGERDGKTMHKYLTNSLLHSAGMRAPGGYFTQYEEYIKRVTPEHVMNCEDAKEPVVEKESGIKGFLGRLPFFKGKKKEEEPVVGN